MAKRDSKRVLVIDDCHEPDVSSVLAKILEIERSGSAGPRSTAEGRCGLSNEQQPPHTRKRARALA